MSEPVPARRSFTSQESPSSTNVGSGPVRAGSLDPRVEGAMGSFVGRTAELAFLRSRLTEVESGLPRTVVLEAPGGTGKSTLLQAFLSDLDPAGVLKGSGEEGETELAYGVLDQLLGLRSNAAAWPDPFTAGARLLEQVDDRPLTVFVIDDAHLADAESLSALTFALRRLQADRVLAVLATRDAELLPASLLKLADSEDGRLRLPGLGVDDVADLAAQRGHAGLPRHAAERLRQHTGGNPLHLRTLLDDLSAAELLTTGPLPAPRSFGQLVLRTLETVSGEAAALARAAAVLPDGSALVLVADTAEVSAPESALDELTRANLLTCSYADDGWQVAFAHPLVRAAVHDGLGPLERRRLHLRAADLTHGDLGVMHRVAAASGPDPELAETLGRRAAERAAEGDSRAAAQLYLKAAGLGGPGPARDAAVQEAANQLLITGDLAAAKQVAARLGETPESALRFYLQARIAWFTGDPAEAERLALLAWERSAELDGTGRGGCAAILAQLSNLAGEGLAAADWATRALAEPLPPDLADTTSAARAVGLALVGRAREALESLGGLPARPSESTTDQQHQLTARGALRGSLDDLAGARADLQALVDTSSDVAPQRLIGMGVLAEVDFRLGRWDSAYTMAEHALSLAEASEQVWVQGFLHAAVAQVAAARGDFDTAEDQLATARSLATSLGDPATFVVCEQTGIHLAACRSEPALVVERAGLLGLLDEGPTVEPGWLTWPIPYLSALVELGRLDEAEAALAPFEEVARERQVRSRLAALARVRGELATARRDNEVARGCFEEALETGDGVVDALEHGLTLAAYGRFLRRRGERKTAQERLLAARHHFLGLGAQPFVARVDEELAASGLPAEPAPPSAAAGLTPQEQLVAGLACQGMSNQEIAHHLVLSVKTVGYHLGNVYSKLDVHSRAQLVVRLGSEAR